MGLIKSAVKWIAIFGLILLLSSYLLPRNLFVARVTAIDAPPEAVFAQINSLQQFAKWSPWADEDPNMQTTFSGPDTGVGNRMEWQSDNPNVGSGSQIITASIENEMVGTMLDFGEMGQGRADFRISEKEGGTAVEWNFQTDLGLNPISRWMGLVISESVGEDYERGLERLKATAEAQ